MRFVIGILVLCLFPTGEIKAQEPEISGDWTMFEKTCISGDEVRVINEDQLRDQGLFTDYFFLPDKKLRLVTNMTGSGNLETAEGTWTLEGDELICSIRVDANLMDIVWGFEFRDDMIHLKRSFPDGSTSVVNSFKRK